MTTRIIASAIISASLLISMGAAISNEPHLVQSSTELSQFVSGIIHESGTLLFNSVKAKGSGLLIAAPAGNIRELMLPSSDKGSRVKWTFLDPGNIIILLRSTSCWFSQDNANSWSMLATAPRLLFRSHPLAIANLGRLKSITINTHSGEIKWHGPKHLENFQFHEVSVLNGSAIAAVQFDGMYGEQTFGVIKTDDNGRTWDWLVTEGGFSPDTSLNYHAHHLFELGKFIWISSDISDDIIVLNRSSKIWSRITTPDRVVSAMFLKNEKEVRIIGGSTGVIYETSDGGFHWNELSRKDILSPSFLDFFRDRPLHQWNDFSVFRYVIETR